MYHRAHACIGQVTAGGDVELFEYPGRGNGEAVHPRTGLYRCVCRSLVVVPAVANGQANVYWTNAQGDVLQYCAATRVIDVVLESANGMRRDYFGTYVDHANMRR